MLQSKIEELLQGKAEDINIDDEMYAIYLKEKKLLQTKFGKDWELYLQGSVRYGTPIKPYSPNSSVSLDIDIDIVAEHTFLKNNSTTEKDLKLQAEYPISGLKHEEKNPCWRLPYENKFFYIDITPCVLNPKTNGLKWGQYSVDITYKNNISYVWRSSNPKGYYIWFKEVNKKAHEFALSQLTENVINRYQSYQIDNFKPLIRTNLQKTIQIAKWLRDKYFYSQPNKEYKPISIILTTLITEVFAKYTERNDISIEELLKNFITIMKTMEQDKQFIFNSYSKRIDRTIDPIKAMYRDNGKWNIPNPTDDSENFANRWNESDGGQERVSAFFEFIDYLDKILKNEIELKRTLYSTPINKMSERKPYGH